VASEAFVDEAGADLREVPAATAWWWRSARPAAVAMAAAWAVSTWQGRGLDPVPPSAAASIAEALTARGLAASAADVTWVEGPSGIAGAIAGRARALVCAGEADDPKDLFVVSARLSPEGSVLEVNDVWNLTDTSGADESRALVRGRFAAYTTRVEGGISGVHVLDLDGADAAAQGSFTWIQRAQMAVTNWQQTGQTRGVAHAAFVFDRLAPDATLRWDDDGLLEVQTPGRRIVIDPQATRVVAGADAVRVVPDERSRPGNVVTWAVDRVRAVPWFGDERMQWIKAVAFTALDRVRAAVSRGTTADDVRDELGLDTAVDSPLASPATFTDPEIGWPPAPMKPLLAALPGEGRWIPLDKDPFITPTAAGSAPPFVTSFIRPDRQRPDVRVYITLWDPRQIALHMEAGTVEPISATGEHGSGMIPRTPEVLNHVVAAFNGGFQAQHGEYGMRADGVEYLPAKPYSATVVELSDGSNGFGAWPASPAVPADVVALRQNLTALVQNDRFNPWGRTWWGGAPPGWPDQIHTARSALCLTHEGYVGYFYSTSISAEDLAQGMLAARCSFGIHLDMNPGHAGFEFYDVAAAELGPLGRPLQADWEAQGKVPDMPGYVFRARRMIRGMGHMLFPRYIQREARDFFYLTSRAVLPGAPATAASASPHPEPDEGVWRTRGLPQHGFPFAIATTWLRAGAELKLRVVRADPRTLKPASDAGGNPLVLSFVAPRRGPSTLWWTGSSVAIGALPPVAGAVPLAAGFTATDIQARTARAAAGVEDEDGMLVWVELPPEAQADAATAAAMDAALGRLGCGARLLLPGESRVMLGENLDSAGDPIPLRRVPVASIQLTRSSAPDAHAIFPDTPIVPISVWQPLQAKRVRYFPPPPTAAASASASPEAVAPARPALGAAETNHGGAIH
jgi:hypothetical protein